MAYKQIEKLQEYGNKTLLRWKHPQHVDFIIATNYDPLKNEWAHGTYISAMNNDKIDEVQTKAERAFFMAAVREIDGGIIDVEKLDKLELEHAHIQFWNQFRIPLIKDYLQEKCPEILNTLEDKDIQDMAETLTYKIEDDYYVNDCIADFERNFVADVVKDLKVNKSKCENTNNKENVKASIQPDKAKITKSLDKDAR